MLNHRSIADFFLHDCITGYRASHLSRMMVAVLLPGTWLCTFMDNSVWYFVRGGRGSNLEPFFKWIDDNFEARRTQRRSLIVYPEGHRNTKSHPLPLKKGFIRVISTLRVVFVREEEDGAGGDSIWVGGGYGCEEAMDEDLRVHHLVLLRRPRIPQRL
eukprot:TRINITY_DN2383_c0_g6_i1.p2 TRINITY_DN2383_c0_g6~~TRINITY_DN2383_c0_g6_i1.p2  ORF type:complete len:158 (+),score=0.93 TRINITY_DN2383_c0_g6_i1:511-984(+)